MKKRIIPLLLLFSLILITVIPSTPKIVFADELSENINEQLGNLDLSALEEFMNSLDSSNGDSVVFKMIYQMLNGEYNTNHSSFWNYLIDVIFSHFNDLIPSMFAIIAISVFCALIQNAKSTFVQEGVSEIIFFVCFLTVFMLISGQVLTIWTNTKKTLENIAKLNEIMSPIILTLMISSGGSVSAGIYKPSTILFSNVVINTMLYVVLPLTGLILIFGVVSLFSKNFKLNKFVEFFTGVVKWVIGISITFYGFFITIQGISGSFYDGISMKAAKYAISNSIPMIGGFLKDGFDLFVAGSILIKNSIGVACVFALLIIVLYPIICIGVFTLLLKLVAAVTETLSDSKISDLCTFVSKSMTYVNVSIIFTGVMMFISILLMIFSASAFI